MLFAAETIEPTRLIIITLAGFLIGGYGHLIKSKLVIAVGLTLLIVAFGLFQFEISDRT